MATDRMQSVLDRISGLNPLNLNPVVMANIEPLAADIDALTAEDLRSVARPAGFTAHHFRIASVFLQAFGRAFDRLADSLAAEDR